MINVHAVIAAAREHYIQIIATRDGVDPARIIPLAMPSPGDVALCTALVEAINKELAK